VRTRSTRYASRPTAGGGFSRPTPGVARDRRTDPTRRLTVARPQIRILASIENPYIIKFNEAFVEQMNLYIITEYAAKGDMFQRLRRLAQKRQMMPEDLAWVFFIQLCLGIKALHDNNILHRSVEPQSPLARTCAIPDSDRV